MEYTRQDRMKGLCTHEEYWSQFVNNNVLSFVQRCMSDSNFTNDIKYWDRVQLNHLIDLEKWRRLMCPQFIGTNKYGWSFSDNVCIAKMAVDILKGETQCY